MTIWVGLIEEPNFDHVNIRHWWSVILCYTDITIFNAHFISHKDLVHIQGSHTYQGTLTSWTIRVLTATWKHWHPEQSGFPQQHGNIDTLDNQGSYSYLGTLRPRTIRVPTATWGHWHPEQLGFPQLTVKHWHPGQSGFPQLPGNTDTLDKQGSHS